MNSDRVEYDRAVVVGVLRDLEQIVVSLDRIGSFAYDQTKAESDATLAAFMTDWDVDSKLANARMLLSDAFSREQGIDEMDELERELTDVVFWSSSVQAPKGNV